MKPSIPATLICADTTNKAHLAVKAIERSLKQADFAAVKLLTNNSNLKYAVKIPEIVGLAAYSKFCIRDLTKYVDTPFCLLVQSDGYVINGAAWSDSFYKYDWGGAPWNPSGIVGNGGASWRSKRLLNACATLQTGDSEHSEDQWISVRHRAALEARGVKYMPPEIAHRFSFEGRAYDGVEWRGVPNKWAGQLCFHSFLSVLPPDKKPCKVFHHSGDNGDVIYGMAAMKALGGGMLFLSADNKYPYPLPSRWVRMGADPEWVNNLKPLIMAQDYAWGCNFTHGTPFSTDYDLNKFRLPWRNRTAKDFDSILKLHMDAFNLPLPTEPWLTVSDPIVIPGKTIVASRSERYLDPTFPWGRFCYKWGDRIVFVGTEKEHNLFKGLAAPKFNIPHYKTKDVLELARVIAGAKVFAGNQSLALAIAHGLYKPVVCECWPQNSNCEIRRPMTHYGMPEELLV